MLPPPLEIFTNRQNLNPHKPPAQPCCSTQCSLYHTCCTLQSLSFSLQCPMACPGLATHTLGGPLCAQWLPSTASIAEQLQILAKPQPSQTTCTGLPQHPVQAPPNLLSTAEAAFDLPVAHGMPRAGYTHTGRALCAVVAEHSLHQ